MSVRMARPLLKVVIPLFLIGIVALAVLFIDRVSDPLVLYYGTVMRTSTMTAQAHGVTPLFCQQLASFSFDANYACFDTKQELDAFADAR